ncbi:MAG: SAM-dependent methyltransferase [Gammaproteobacteria bacterium]|jgi:SAM-dependent MidA family methyltransferase|nr:SAM-dependent methyltransferase [Gammaproteobacteria bacterium]
MPSPPQAQELQLDASHREHEARVRAHMDARISAAGADGLEFSRFMAEALYAPGLGYYATGPGFGEQGDFITAPEVSPLFGRCVAQTCADWLEQLGAGAEILEVGAGSGALVAELLPALAASQRLPRAYRILELSPALREQQQARVAQLAPELRERVRWCDDLPEAGFVGVILGNELLDSLPAHVFRCGTPISGEESEVQLLHVYRTETGYTPGWAPAPPGIAALVRERLPADTPADYRSELGLAAEAWVERAAAGIDRGALLLFDYGFVRREFFHPQRNAGTLMCHFRHHVSADPFDRVGLQDITTHVEFTAVAEAGQRTGLECLGFTSQAHYLISAGLPGRIDAAATTRERLAQGRAVELLTSPAEMGELVKVIALGRGVSAARAGFSGRDFRGRL